MRPQSFGCGGWIRTSNLRVMSPTSFLLLHPARSLVLYHVGATHASTICLPGTPHATLQPTTAQGISSVCSR